MKALAIIIVIFLLLGGLIALSSLIVAKKPNAAAIIEKLVPFQGLIGIVLFVLGIVYFFVVGPGQLGRLIKANGFVGMIHVAMIVVPLLLGFYYSMLLIASMIPGRTLSENKAVALAEKLGLYSMLLGVVAIGTALAYILQMSGLLGKAMSL
ncbi:MAG: hypothetical protein WKG01_28765 [Kofleriaceae bacterium]